MSNNSQNINKSHEYYFLDDISNCNNIITVQTYFFFSNPKKGKEEESIYVLYNDKFKILPFSRNNMKKILDFYSFFKIFKEKDYNYINILIYKDLGKIPELILDKINSIKPFKEEIENKLKINFPIRDYALINFNEGEYNYRNNDIIQPHAFFILKKKEALKSLYKMNTEGKSLKTMSYIENIMNNNNNHHFFSNSNNNNNNYNSNNKKNNNEIYSINNYMNNNLINNNMNKNRNNIINNINMNFNNKIKNNINNNNNNNNINNNFNINNNINNNFKNFNNFNNNINNNFNNLNNNINNKIYNNNFFKFNNNNKGNNNNFNNNMKSNNNNIMFNNNNMKVNNNNMMFNNNNMKLNNNNMMFNNNNMKLNNNMKFNNNNNIKLNNNNNIKVNSNNMNIMLNNNINMNPNNMNMNLIFIMMMNICVSNKETNFSILNFYITNINNLVESKFKIIKEKQIIFPLKGLRNVGLTCYMNSTLQCLLHIPELNIFFINIYSKEWKLLNAMNNKTDTKGRISEEYNKVLNGVISYNYENYYDFPPSDFNKTLNRYNPQFARQEANDAKDLLIYLFQVMHEELNYLGDQKLEKIPKCNQLNIVDSFMFFYKFNTQLYFSIISYLFYGIVKTRTICSQCKNRLYNFQYFQFLSFPLFNYKDEYFNLYKGFKDYIKKENLTGDNQIYCQFCKKLSNGSSQAKIFYPPPYLLINFDYGKDKKYMPKKINFAEGIDLKEFLEIPEQDSFYELITVSTHIGASGSGGHYITFCKDNNRNWHKFNDSKHSECDYKDIFSFSPYLLLFKKTKNN